MYVPGLHGSYRGNMANATALAGRQGWIAATLPLFKQTVDREEPSGGVIVSFEDYAVIARAYRALLGQVFATVPNIDRAHSALVGFSNGAITIAVLVSNHDEFTLTHFRAFCLVDQGMFHLGDLHKRGAREAKFLLLVGDEPDLGRDLKIAQAQLQEKAWRLLGVDFTCRVMENTDMSSRNPKSRSCEPGSDRRSRRPIRRRSCRSRTVRACVVPGTKGPPCFNGKLRNARVRIHGSPTTPANRLVSVPPHSVLNRFNNYRPDPVRPVALASQRRRVHEIEPPFHERSKIGLGARVNKPAQKHGIIVHGFTSYLPARGENTQKCRRRGRR